VARFVLIHGAFAGAWSWDLVVPELIAAGHVVDAPDLPGSGDDGTPFAEVTLDAYARRICEVLAERPEPAVLVGHSMGGVAVTAAAVRCSRPIAQLIYVCAFLPGDGDTLVGLTELPEGAGDMVQAHMVVEGEPPVATMPAEAAREAFFGCCEEHVAREAAARLGPQPLAPFVTPVSLGPEHIGALPRRSYVVCTKDRSLPVPLQRRMARERANGAVVELNTDHSPFLSTTAELVAVLERLALGPG